METQNQRTVQDVLFDWQRKGISARRWSKQHGFSPVTVHEVLRGKNSGKIGAGHCIAVALGIKEGEIDAS